VVNTILKEADLFCPNSVRINFTIYLVSSFSPAFRCPNYPYHGILQPFHSKIPPQKKQLILIKILAHLDQD
ncbi:hypothetical protein RAO27_12245, partial [Lactiplantibacillus plantarum]